jgi:transposase
MDHQHDSRLREDGAVAFRTPPKRKGFLTRRKTGIEENQPVMHTWGEKGKTPVVRVSGNRRKVSVISAISPRGRLWFRCHRGTLNAERYVEFIRDLLGEFTKKVVLVAGKHPAHVAASTRRFLETVKRRLSVHHLPSYAPELNPDEHVWAYLERMLRSDPVRDDERIDDRVEQNMRSTRALPQFLRRFFDDPNVRYIKDAVGW